MNRDEYWLLIERALDQSGGEHDAHEEALQRAVGALAPDAILDFERHSRDLLAASYQNRLWGAAYLINGGCSDDGFDYFRAWLVAQGRSVYEAALAKPDSLAEYARLGDGDVELEALWYVANRAYEAVTGKPIPDEVSADSADVEEQDDDFDFEDDDAMSTRYPRLWARFVSGDDRSD